MFCGAGGCSVGYAAAGFEVVGVDREPQRNYPFEFWQMDALGALSQFGNEFDVIHASPPCQEYSALRHLHPDKRYFDLIDVTRNALKGHNYIIENVPGAPLRNPVRLCGSFFGLKVRRHRLFESNMKIVGTSCDHKKQGQPIDVSGTGGPRRNRRVGDHGGSCNKPENIEAARNAIQIDWMTRKEISQAIPPAYTEWIGNQIKGELP